MTQAFNLSQFANNLNSSGATTNSGLQNSSVTVTAGTGMSGGGSVALGSSVTLTNAGVTSIVAGSGISISGSTGAVTVTNVTPYIAGPAFSAYQSSAQSFSSSTWTKVQCQTEEFDTNSNYDNATNYRFTPTVAGYYQVNGTLYYANGQGTSVSIYKNGTEFKRGYDSNDNCKQAIVSCLIYCNGTTDYIELYGWFSTARTTSPSVWSTYFQASMTRSA